MNLGTHNHICPVHGLWACPERHCQLHEVASCDICEPDWWDEYDEPDIGGEA